MLLMADVRCGKAFVQGEVAVVQIEMKVPGPAGGGVPPPAPGTAPWLRPSIPQKPLGMTMAAVPGPSPAVYM